MHATDTPNLLYLACDPWPWGEPHEAPRVHHVSRQRGSMAARGACAAGEAVAHRHARDHLSGSQRCQPGCLQEWLAPTRLRRESKFIIVTRGTPAALAAKNATAAIPVIMAAIGEPLDAGVVASLARPGGNVT